MATYPAATFGAEAYEAVLLVPHDVPLREVPRWLDENLPGPSAKARLVLFDGREVTDDAVGLKQLIVSLNQMLRRRPDVIFVPPTNSRTTARERGA